MRLSQLGGYSVTFSPDGKRLASFAGVGFAVWDFEKRSLVTNRFENAGEPATFGVGLTWSPDGHLIVTTSV